METENHKSKRKKLNEYSGSPLKIIGEPEELGKRNNSSGIKLDSSKGLFSKTSRKKQTALSTRCKVEAEAIEDSDILIIDDGKESASEVSSIPGKLDFLSLVLEFFKKKIFFLNSLFSPLSFSVPIASFKQYKMINGSLTDQSLRDTHI